MATRYEGSDAEKGQPQAARIASAFTTCSGEPVKLKWNFPDRRVIRTLMVSRPLDHPEAELFGDFPESVLLEAIAHSLASVRANNKAMLNAVYLRTPSRSALAHLPGKPEAIEQATRRCEMAAEG